MVVMAVDVEAHHGAGRGAKTTTDSKGGEGCGTAAVPPDV